MSSLVEANAGRVTREDIEAIRRPEFFGPVAALAYANSLAQRLQPDDPPEIISDVLYLQTRALI
ncbi:MAG: hypothetical protein ACK4XK_02270, partial [Casimicrobiaceae bacterium]